VDELTSLLARDVVLWTDGGGRVKAARQPVDGAERVARFLIAIAGAAPPGARTPALTRAKSSSQPTCAPGDPLAANAMPLHTGQCHAAERGYKGQNNAGCHERGSVRQTSVDVGSAGLED
jgi:hypothetical protein